MATFQTYVPACRLTDRLPVWAALKGSADQPAAFPLIRAGEPVVLSSVAIAGAYRKRYGA
jgi:hypothetical protein